jgi:hypothetical protein
MPCATKSQISYQDLCRTTVTTVGIATGVGRGMGKACAVVLGDVVDALLLVDLDAEAAATAKELTDRARHRPARRRRPGRRAPLSLIEG